MSEHPARTEHHAKIAPAGEFRDGSFRRKAIADGVTLVLGKRPGSRTTETQAVRFAADVFTPTQARAWLARNGYHAIGFEAANPDGLADSANPPPGDSPANAIRLIAVEAHLEAAARGMVDAATSARRISDAWRTARVGPDRDRLLLDADRLAERIKTWAAYIGAAEHEVVGWRRAAAVWREPNPSDANPCACSPPASPTMYGPPVVPELVEPPPESNPRTLVEIGRARELTIDTGRRFSWAIADDWRILTPAGAEQLPQGQGRLFIVPPPRNKRGKVAPEASAAAETFKTWHSFGPLRAVQLEVPGVEDFRERIGQATSIVYRSHKWSGKRTDYEHHFSRRLPPDVLILGSVETPRAVLVRGGEFRVTARGIVD